MKKLLVLPLALISMVVYSQCSINGKDVISVGTTETYSIDNEVAQCKDCHLWSSVGGNATIQSDNRQNAIYLNAKNQGRQVISLSVLTPQGLRNCNKSIDIISQITPNSGLQETNVDNSNLDKKENGCNIKVNNFKEVKYSENIVSFFPNVMAGDFKYTYTAYYDNGEEFSSNEKVPQFPYSKENGIKSVKVKILASTCLKEFTKTYEANYWKFF